MNPPDVPSTAKIVNVAAVPHRSPLRYPGGKTWLVPRIRLWLHSLDLAHGSSSNRLPVEPSSG